MNHDRYVEIRKSFDLSVNPRITFIAVIQTGALIAVSSVLLTRYSDSSWKYLAIPLIATVMFRSFSLMHEAVHGLASRRRSLNTAIGIVFGGLSMLFYDSWKEAHLEHHRWSGNVDKDPVMALIKTFPGFPESLRSTLTSGWKRWIPTLAFMQYVLFWTITVRYILKKPQSLSQLMSIAFPIVLWGAVFWIAPWSTVLSALLPAIVLYFIGVEVVNLPHHLGLPLYHGETKIPLSEQHLIARTCVYPVWLSRFVVLNFNYHTEHHMYPSIPWYHLEKLHDKVLEELKDRYNSDPQFAWILRNRKRDLVDVLVPSQDMGSEQSKAA